MDGGVHIVVAYPLADGTPHAYRHNCISDRYDVRRTLDYINDSQVCVTCPKGYAECIEVGKKVCQHLINRERAALS